MFGGVVLFERVDGSDQIRTSRGPLPTQVDSTSLFG